MKSKIYTLNEHGKLVPESDTLATVLPIGQIVTYEDRANPRRKFVILGAVAPSDYVTPGTMRALCLSDGHETQVRTVDDTGHAGWQLGNRVLCADEILDAIKLAGENKARLADERERAVEIETQRKAAQRVKWAGEFPHLKKFAAGEISHHALGAKNLRKELARAFPGVKFSVTSDSYSGGDSIDVRWESGPTTEAVERISGKYQEGHFDGMDDSYNYDRANQWPEIYGGAKYVHESRSFPPEIHEQIGRGLCALQKVEYDGQWTRGLLGENDDRDLQQHVNTLLSKTTFAPGAVFAGVDYKEKSSQDCDTFKRLHDKYGDGFCGPKRGELSADDEAALLDYESRMNAHWCRIIFKGPQSNSQDTNADKPADERAADIVARNPAMLADALANTKALNQDSGFAVY